MKRKILVASALALFTTPAMADIINIDAVTNTGGAVTLAAGTYQASLIGIADGGNYDGWSPWNYVTCTSPGPDCTGFTDRFAITFIDDGGVTEHAQVSLFDSNGQNDYYSTAALSLAAFQAGAANNALVLAPNNAPGVSLINGVMSFTLSKTTVVTFGIDDSAYGDNSGGISLSLSGGTPAVPEPASWAMMICGFGVIGAAFRNRKAAPHFARL